MEYAWSRCRGGGADNKKITFIFQNEPFLLLTGYLEFHFSSQGKSWKSQGILSWKKCGNPAVISNENYQLFICSLNYNVAGEGNLCAICLAKRFLATLHN